MARYTVTIEQDVDNRSAEPLATAIIRLDVGGATPGIVEMVLKSSGAGGLLAATLPRIDLEGVIAALQTGVGRAAIDRRPTQTMPASTENSAEDTDSLHQTPHPAVGVTSMPAKPDGKGERVYRKMPPEAELLATFDRIGTVTGLAKHYGVPRHTAQGWIGRLRKRISSSTDSTQSP